MVRALRACGSAWNRRTMKREFAALLVFAVWAPTHFRMFFWPPDVAVINALGVYYTTLTTIVMVVAGAALGLDAWVKQIAPAQQKGST